MEASATDGLGAVANVMAGPATVVVVVGVVVEPPGLVPFAIPSDAIAWYPVVVGGVADGINSVVNPVVLLPLNWGVSVLEETQGGVNFS